MRAACLQLEVQLCKPEVNARRALALAQDALEQGADILIFPELFLTGFCYHPDSWDPAPYHSLDPFRALAKEHGCLLIGSLMSERLNLGFCLDAEGLQFRPKIHPFSKEKDHFQGGDFLSPVSSIWGKVGLEICYDLRFPEVARSLALQGADFLVTLAQFPAARRAHWRALCIARSIENQLPHLACNWGEGGCSMIVDAWGNAIAEAGVGEQMILGEIDFEERDRIRQELTCFADRRPDVY